jgi:RimJ/RimL family protein N-acetyltransferase
MTTLATDRLLLRPPTATDLDAIAAMWSDPEVVRFIGGGKPFSREQSRQRLLRYVGHWTLFGYGSFSVIDRVTGQFLGDVGVQNFERDIEPPLGPFEAGWVLASSAHGRGLASEALAAVLAWIETKFPGQTTSCIIDTDNAPSLRVAAKAGYRERVRTTYHDTPVVMLDR